MERESKRTKAWIWP